MEVNVGVFDLLKLLGKLIAHKYEQNRLATNEHKIINTMYGKVEGLKRRNALDEYDNYFAFEGIPYAKPPIGDLRFRAPQPPEPWEDVLDCTNYKSKPLQKHFIRKMVEGSEDCLYLNIYARTSKIKARPLTEKTSTLSSEQPLPVMVWIYGGGFQIGEASREIYAPDYFMQKDVILVTFNYRLGPLGFLCLNDPDLQIPGNAGLKDQVLALKWIKQNIENFNGDPNNITVFGESAGGASAHILMLTPQCKGLFHKAILQSGTALCHWADTPQRDWGYKLACSIGYKGNNNDKEVYRYLSKQDAKRLILSDVALLTKQERFDNLLFAFGPVIEPYATEECITTRPYKELLPNAWSNEIPIIIGGNSFEGLFHYNMPLKSNFLINDITDGINLLPDDVRAQHNEKELKEMALKLKQTYFGNVQPSVKETLFEYLDLMSYRTFWHGIYRAIKSRTKFAPQAPTYCYVFDFDSSFFNHYRILKCGHKVRGVSHADDISYLFYNVNSEKLSIFGKEYKCMQQMVAMWFNFALTSKPHCKETYPVKWEPVKDDDDQPIKVLNIGDELKFKDLALHSKLQIWNSFYTKESLI